MLPGAPTTPGTVDLVEATLCPRCRGGLAYDGGTARCRDCDAPFRVVDGVPFLVKEWNYDTVHLDVIRYINHHRNPWNLFTRGLEEDLCRFLIEGLEGAGTVLDIGGGPGFYAEYMRAHGKRTVVYDLAKYFVLKGKRIHPEVKFVLGDATNLIFKEGTFDGVSCVRSMIYVRYIEEALREIYRVLKPGGRLCFIDRNRHSPLHMWAYWRGRYNSTIGEFPFYFTRGRLMKLLRKVGFEVERVRGDHVCLPFLIPVPSQQRPGLRKRISRGLARAFPFCSFYLAVYARRPR